jgi:UDP-3-O-[3-hydroxymyristoyl] glucosamine N-acyltransferase
MTGLVVIGAGRFAVEVSRYIEDVAAAGRDGFRIQRYLSTPGETVHVPDDRCVPLEGYEPEAGTRVVLALPDPVQRRAVIDGVITTYALVAENIVHPSSRIDPAQLAGPGNIIGPNCYVGVNVTLGGFNVINYHCTVGNHSHIGSNNFIAPNFHCGNGVEVGDDNFFGLSCTVVPEVVIGDNSRFQAGLTLFEDAPSGHSYLVPSRVKAIKSL